MNGDLARPEGVTSVASFFLDLSTRRSRTGGLGRERLWDDGLGEWLF